MTEVLNESIEALIKVFGTESRVIVLSANAGEPRHFTFEGSTVTVTEQAASREHPEDSYDIAILTGEWTKADLLRCFGCQSRKEIYETLHAILPKGGQVLLIAESPFFLTNLQYGLRVFQSILNRNKCGRTFLRRHSLELEHAGFSKTTRYMIYPDVSDIRQLVSTHRIPYLDFMSQTYRQTPRIPREARKWIRWTVIYLGLGRILIPCQLIRAQR